MNDGQWDDWAAPLGILLAKADEFLKQIYFSNYPRGGILVQYPGLYLRKEELAKAFEAYITDMLIGDFLKDYVYVSTVYEDAYSFAFEYIGENEHQMELHGDEFAQNETDLLEDFCLYIGNWSSPYWRSLE